MGDYQALYRQLEAVESNIPSVGLVEETEDRLSDRIALYQVQLHHTHRTLDQTRLHHNIHTTPGFLNRRPAGRREKCLARANFK